MRVCSSSFFPSWSQFAFPLAPLRASRGPGDARGLEAQRRTRLTGLVNSVRLIDNSSDSSSSSCTGPTTLYDSALDPDWPSPHSSSDAGKWKRRWDEGGWVDATGFVEGRVRQGEDGRVVRVEGREDGAGDGKEGNDGKEGKDGKL